MNLLQNLSSRKLITGLALLIVVAAVPLTVYIAQKQQEIRQRAAGEQTEFYFSQITTQQNSNLYFTYNQPSVFSLYLDTKGNAISGFDVTITFPNSQGVLMVNSLTEADGASRFTSPVFNNIDASNNTITFSKVTTDTNTAITGVLHLADITITGRVQTGNGNVVMTNATVTSATSPTELTSSKPTASYTISAAPTRVIGSPTPTGIQASLSAAITGPATGNTGESLRYITTANGQNLRGVEIFRAKVGSDITKREAWTNVASNLSCNNQATCATSGNFTPSENGQYYVAANAYELNNARICSGNPAVKDGRVTGWAVCGPNDLITLTVGNVSTGSARFTFTLDLPGIGLPPKNNNPKTNPRTIKVELFDSNNDSLPVKTDSLPFNNTTNLFKGTVDMGTLLPGHYTMKVKTGRYLKKPVPGIITINERTTPYVIPTLTLTVGDINNDGKIDVLDFTIWLDCYHGKERTGINCSDVDFNDDGIIRGDEGLTDLLLLQDDMGAKEGD